MTPLSSRAFRATGIALRCALLAGAATLGIGSSADARDCPGNPNALGTSRTLVVDPREHPRIGTMQYAETLPLQDREVVLTFDDGPLPKYTNQILDTLAAECVQATFFVVGQMAKAHPEGVRRIRDLGHTIGTHSENHPLSMNRMPLEQARQQIDDGIAATTAALGGEAPAPFFRIPGLLRAEAVESYLVSQGLQTWSADFPANDWHKISAEQVHALAMSRLIANGKGMILLHDIQPRTVAALPMILRDLKVEGFRIVHVVAARTDLAKTETGPQQWRSHPVSDRVALKRWPAIPNFVFASRELLPVPQLSVMKPNATIAVAGSFDPAAALPRRPGLLGVSSTQAPAIWFTATPTGESLPAPAQALFAAPKRAFELSEISIPIAPVATIASVAAARTSPQDAADDLIGRLIAETTGSIGPIGLRAAN